MSTVDLPALPETTEVCSVCECGSFGYTAEQMLAFRLEGIAAALAAWAPPEGYLVAPIEPSLPMKKAVTAARKAGHGIFGQYQAMMKVRPDHQAPPSIADQLLNFMGEYHRAHGFPPAELRIPRSHWDTLVADAAAQNLLARKAKGAPIRFAGVPVVLVDQPVRVKEPS